MNEICSGENIILFCVYHLNFNKDMNKHLNLIYYGVNETYEKIKENDVILEYELEKYNPLLQKRGYMETSAYLHVYWNQLYKNKEMVGFSQYDMKHEGHYNNLNKNMIYLLIIGKEVIVHDHKWNHLICPELRNLNFLIESYNRFFNKHYSIQELENMPFSLWQTNIYPVKIYEKLCKWLDILTKEIYPWSNEHPYETHFGSIGGYTERAISIFNAYEIYEGVKYENLNITNIEVSTIKHQYHKQSFLNNYSQDIHTKFIENITGNYDVQFCMFKSQCYLNGITYSCERIHKDGINGLYFKRDDWMSPKQYGFNIGGEDPRLLILHNKVYVIFTCVFNEPNIQRGIAITEFDNYNPILLKIKNNQFNHVEKNWSPFVKENELYFMYNVDPLVILKYDFNEEGLCDIIFTQNNIQLPFDVNNKYLRGGSNLIHYQNEYYIGGCHSRLHYNGIYYNTHIILLDTIKWKIVYLSKPIMYHKPKDLTLDCIPNTTIINHKSILPYHSTNLHNIQAPCSMYIKDSKYYITVDINCHITLLYELIIDIPIKDNEYSINEIENMTYMYNKTFIDNQ